jgi:hypothetical protein
MPVVGLPAPTRPGTYYLLACADGAHAFSEVSDKNNCRAATDPVVVADRAQARVSAVDVLQAHVAAGASLRLRVRVRQPAHPGARTVGIYLARRPSAGGRPIRVGTLTAPPAAGVVRASGSVTLPRRAPASPLRFLLACVGRPSAGRCLVAPRPVFVIHRAR